MYKMRKQILCAQVQDEAFDMMQKTRTSLQNSKRLQTPGRRSLLYGDFNICSLNEKDVELILQFLYVKFYTCYVNTSKK